MYNLIFVAVCCSILQYVAVCCREYQRLMERDSAGSARQHLPSKLNIQSHICCNVLLCVAGYLQFVAVCCREYQGLIERDSAGSARQHLPSKLNV